MRFGRCVCSDLGNWQLPISLSCHWACNGMVRTCRGSGAQQVGRGVGGARKMHAKEAAECHPQRCPAAVWTPLLNNFCGRTAVGPNTEPTDVGEGSQPPCHQDKLPDRSMTASWHGKGGGSRPNWGWTHTRGLPWGTGGAAMGCCGLGHLHFHIDIDPC